MSRRLVAALAGAPGRTGSLLLVLIAIASVLTDPATGQTGGYGGRLGAGNGTGGTSSATSAGTNGTFGGANGGGGGGGGGVTGGHGGAGSRPGGAGGATAGAAGGNGSPAVGIRGGSGGGGGAHGAVVTITSTNTVIITGGNGGSGGAAIVFGGGGGGGAGGYGIVVNAPITFTNSGTITGGNGGNGGNGGGPGSVGEGGDAGHGVDVAAAGAVLNNSGSITGGNAGNSGIGPFAQGGAGGAGVIGSSLTVSNTGTITGGNGGVASGTFPIQGAGGAGIAGSGLSITNGGSIIGGLSGDGVTRANAITFTGGTNSLTLLPGSAITGNVVAASNADTLALGGGGSASFDVSSIGPAAQYQGFGVFQKVGTGTWALTGTTAATTSWTIIAGTLNIASDAALGASNGGLTLNGGTLRYAASLSSARTVTVGPGGGALDTNGNDATLTGTISGAGALSKSGAGTLLLAGNSAGFTGTTTVNTGTLEVGDAANPGARLGGNVSVTSGAMLMGHGTIGGNVANSGTVQPGGTIGVMTVTGNYAQSPAGTLTIEITPNAAAGPGLGYSQLSVGGTASLAGGLSIIDDPGTYAVGSRYTILTAAGGRTGVFASVAYNPAFAAYITPAVTYDANDVFLTLDPTPAPAGPPPLFNGGQQIPDALTAMVSAVQGVGDTVLGDVCGPTAQRLVTQGEGCVVRPLGAGYRAEVWMRGFGGIGSLNGSGTRFSFDNSYAGALIGAGIGQGGFTVGFGGGYLMTALNFNDGSNASQNAGLGFLYGRYAQGPLWFGAMAAYGGGKVSGARSLPGTGLTASGDRGADFGIVQAQGAYDIPLGAVTFEPRASLSYIHAGQAAFSESGAGILDLTYSNTDTDVLEGRLIGRVMTRFVTGSWTLVPYVEAGVQETFTGLSRDVTMADGAFTGSAAGISPAPTAGIVGAGIAAGMSEAVDLFLNYQGQLSANTVGNRFAAGVEYRF